MVCRGGTFLARVLGVSVITALAWGCQQQPPPAETVTAAPEAEATAPVPPSTDAPAEETPATAAEETQGTEERALRFVNPVRGTADVGHLAPKTKVEGNMVVTTIEVKNLSDKAIAGLKIDEFWWDRANNPVTGDTARLRQPLMPGETATLTLRTPKHPQMHRNSYQFSHAYGRVKTTLLRTLG